MPHHDPVQLAVIFDVDGVLVDSYQPHLQSWISLANEYGVSVTEEEFASLFGRTSGDIIRDIWDPDLPDEQVVKMDNRKEALYRELLTRDFPTMDGAIQLIDALVKAGFLLAVGSSGAPENVEMSLQGLGRTGSFSAIVTGKDVTRGKPDPQPYLIAAKRLGVKPSNCAVIEDAPAGITAALAGGMTAIALLGTASADRLNRAHLVVKSLRELAPQRIADLIRRRTGLLGIDTPNLS